MVGHQLFPVATKGTTAKKNNFVGPKSDFITAYNTKIVLQSIVKKTDKQTKTADWTIVA